MKKKSTPKNKFRAKAYADLSLQFYKDKKGDGYFLITTNECEHLFNAIDDLIFSKDFAFCKNLSREEKLQVCKLFIRAKEIIEEFDIK